MYAYEDAFIDGFNAARTGMDQEQNPWLAGSLEYEQWNAGFTAFAEDEADTRSRCTLDESMSRS